MYIEQIPLSIQLDLVFQQIKPELELLSSGTVFIQIRNNEIGKFGIRHFPIETKGGDVKGLHTGLSDQQRKLFRQLSLESLKHKKHWTHGEIQYDFAIRQDSLHVSVLFESNYNMSTLLPRSKARK